MVVPAQSLDNARGHDALRTRVTEAIEQLASDEGLSHPEQTMATFDEEVREVLSGTAAQVRGIAGKQAAVQIKMHRGGPGESY